MKFDKSKVCVAGLHDVPVGAKGYYANCVRILREVVEKGEIRRKGYCVKSTDQGYMVEKSTTVWSLFYPIQEKQYRPFETIEEALTLKGRWLKHKNWDSFIEVTSIAMLNGCALINGIDPSFIYELYTMEDGTPVGVEI